MPHLCSFLVISSCSMVRAALVFYHAEPLLRRSASWLRAFHLKVVVQSLMFAPFWQGIDAGAGTLVGSEGGSALPVWFSVLIDSAPVFPIAIRFASAYADAL